VGKVGRHFRGGTEENIENIKKYSVLKPRFEYGLPEHELF
jgi:hypothetical protein